jgi:hypothetical protein
MQYKEAASSYIMEDIESDGPIPREYPMISIGKCVGLSHARAEASLRTTQWNHNPLDDAKADPEALLYMKEKISLEIHFE